MPVLYAAFYITLTDGGTQIPLPEKYVLHAAHTYITLTRGGSAPPSAKLAPVLHAAIYNTHSYW